MLTEVTEADVMVEATATPTRSRKLLQRLPDLVGAATAGFAVPAMLLLLAGFFVMPLVILLGTAGAIAAVVLVGWRDDEPTLPRDTVWVLAALAVSVAFFVINAVYSAQNIYPNRDPGTYSLTGQWLVHHHSVLIPAKSQVFGDVPGLTSQSAGFNTDVLNRDDLYAQGNHLLPVLLGVAGWIAGPAGLFRMNALIGALALLAMFGLVRRFAGGAIAFVATATLAASMPMMAFSRDTYTEPLTLLLLFGGLSILWRAIETGRRWQFLVAGLTVGASAMARIDGYAALLAIIVVGATLLAAAMPGRRRGELGRVALLMGGMVLTAGIGYLDASRLSSGYYRDLRANVLDLITAGAALALVGMAVVIVAWTTPLIRWLVAEPRRVLLSRLGAGAVVLMFGVLASRPLWMVGHGGCSASVAGLQRGLGLPIDPCRTYYEHTVSWLAWYFGWPMVVMAVLGLALLVRRTVVHRDIRLLGLIGMTLALSALYLVDASISPDQIWAMRRFLPVVIPGLLASAAYLLYVISRAGRGYQVLAAGLALVMMGMAAFVSYPVARVRTGVPQLAQVRAVCKALPDNAAVVSLGVSAIGTYVQTMRSFCNVPSSAMATPTAPALAQVRQNAARSGRALYVIAESPGAVPFVATASNPRPFFVAHVTKLPERLTEVPGGPNHYDVPLFLGAVGSDGRVTPVRASG